MFSKRLYKIAFFVFCILPFWILSQTHLTKQELYKTLSKPQNDTTLIDAYTELCWPIYANENLDSSVYFGKKAIELATKINDIKRLSVTHRRIGIAYINFSYHKKALFHQEESYALSKKIQFKKGMQLALNNIGVIYLNNELYSKALSYFLSSLKIVEETKDYKSAANIFINCGIINVNIKKYDIAKEYFLNANKNARLQKDQIALIVSYNQLSVVYRLKKKLDSAIIYLDLAKNEQKIITDNYLIFNTKLNEAIILSEQGNHNKSLSIYLNLYSKVKNNNDKITIFLNIGDEYSKLNKTDSAIFYYEKAYQISKNEKLYYDLEYLSYTLAVIFQKKNNLKKFSEYILLHLNYKDSNEKINKTQQIISQQLEFDFSRKQIADSISYLNKEKINLAQLEIFNTKSKSDKLIKIFLLIFLVVIASVAFFIFSRLRLTKKQNKIIAEQKQIVEEKQKEILASINYAKRIQTAILPQEKYIERKLNERYKT